MILLAASNALALVPTFTCGTSSGDLILGLPGLEVPCVLEPPDDGSTWDTTRWTFGDGAVAEGDAVSHVYDLPGQYTISVELDGWEPAPGVPATLGAGDPYVAKHGLVTVCGPPEPEFTTIDKGGLEVQIVNRSTIAVYCLTDLRWDVIPGTDEQGEPELQFEVWEPVVTLPSEGDWTFVLTMGGIGGTSAVAAHVDAEWGLPEGLEVPGGGEGCATPGRAPASAGSVPALAGVAAAAALAVRRRRRSTC